MDNLSKYDSRGVSFDKKEVHEAIKNVDKGLFPKAFCKIIPDLISGNDDYCIVMHADGAGTKSSLAYAYWKETGDISVWKGIAQDALIMNLEIYYVWVQQGLSYYLQLLEEIKTSLQEKYSRKLSMVQKSF